MNSKHPGFDWHAKGIWVVCGKDYMSALVHIGSPYECRAEYLRAMNKRWSVLEKTGHYIQQLVPLEDTVTHHENYTTASESFWRYFADGAIAPSGKVSLLTEGGIQVTGEYRANGGFIAWAPLIKRDKALEERLGL